MTEVDTVADSDLDSYVDNQLDAAGRLRVETWLAQNPEAAARVMADLRIRTTLRLALSEVPVTAVQPQTREAARRLSLALMDRKMWTTFRRVAAVAMLVSAGWFANSSLGMREVIASVHPPAFVHQAVRAHQTALIREGMVSQTGSEIYDRDEIRGATAISMPSLPRGWRVVDVQIFPSEFGPSVETSIMTDDGSRISLFAVRPGHFAVEKVQDLTIDKAGAAWWQLGDVAYAVVSNTPETGLADEAELLKSSLY